MFAGYQKNSVMKDRTTILPWLTATVLIANGKINIIHILRQRSNSHNQSSRL